MQPLHRILIGKFRMQVRDRWEVWPLHGGSGPTLSFLTRRRAMACAETMAFWSDESFRIFRSSRFGREPSTYVQPKPKAKTA